MVYVTVVGPEVIRDPGPWLIMVFVSGFTFAISFSLKFRHGLVGIRVWLTKKLNHFVVLPLFCKLKIVSVEMICAEGNWDPVSAVS
jgi:hypothetical protein